MWLLTTFLLLLAGMALGLARRSWWQIGVLTLLVCGALQVAHLWMGDWRHHVGLPHDERLVEPQVIGWLLFAGYASYALGWLYSRWRLTPAAHRDH
jgi:hypothetical protein